MSRRGVGAAVAGTMVLALAGFGSARWAQASLDREADDFQAPLVQGQEIVAKWVGAEPGVTPETLQLSELRGSAVVLDFWASWCGPCRAEAPVMQRLHERFESEGVRVIGVNTSDDEDSSAAAARAFGMRFPVVFDRRNAIAKSYDVRALPSLVVISKTGKIVAVRTGLTSESTLHSLVTRALDPSS